jgi:hypothetical protein
MIASRRPTATKCTAPGRPKAPIRLTWNLFALFVAPLTLPPGPLQPRFITRHVHKPPKDVFWLRNYPQTSTPHMGSSARRHVCPLPKTRPQMSFQSLTAATVVACLSPIAWTRAKISSGDAQRALQNLMHPHRMQGPLGKTLLNCHQASSQRHCMRPWTPCPQEASSTGTPSQAGCVRTEHKALSHIAPTPTATCFSHADTPAYFLFTLLDPASSNSLGCSLPVHAFSTWRLRGGAMFVHSH